MASDGLAAPRGPAWLGLWWLLYLLDQWTSSVAFRLQRSDDIDTLTASSVVYVISDAFGAAGAVLAIFVIRGVTTRQEQRRMRLGAGISMRARRARRPLRRPAPAAS